MSEAKEVETPISEEKDGSSRPISCAVEPENVVKQSEEEEDKKTAKTESLEESKSCEEDANSLESSESPKSKEDNVVVGSAPTTKILERTKPGECNNLLPVLVERLRSALEQSCSSRSIDDRPLRLEDPSVDNNDEDLRVWASGLSNSLENHRQEEAQSPRGLKLDLKFLEDLLLSDIQTALGRLQETLQRVDIGTLTRYSSTLDPNNKLNLLKLISSLLANLKIPEEAKPENTAKAQSTQPRRRRTDRHTIGVSAEEIARARKWIEEKNLSPSQIDSSPEFPLPIDQEIQSRTQEKSSTPPKENGIDKYENVHEKSMKDAINQQQSLQSKSKDSIIQNGFHEKSEKTSVPPKLIDSYKDDNTIINEEYGISASSLYHQSNAQAKCNKFLAKKSKIKRANTIDIPNYLKLQAESLANSQNGCVSLRRPINIGDKYANFIAGNAVPSFEPKTENDRKFLALISKNNEVATAPPSGSLPFKSFNYRQTVADKNWNSRFSNIKTTFDKPQINSAEDNVPKNCNSVVVGSLRLPYNSKEKIGFSHAPTSPFQKIEKPTKEEMTPSFLKAGYMPKASGTLKAKVKLFDQDPPAQNSSQPIRSKTKQPNAKRASNIFENSDDRSSRVTENGHLNYHSFCKQFAPFASKNPAENHKSNPWTNGNINNNSTKTKTIRDNFSVPNRIPYCEENNKVPVAYKTDRVGKNDRKPRNRKFYETYDGSIETNGHRQVVAYPFEINYQKRPNFVKKNREESSEKGDYEDPEQFREPLTSLQFIKSVLPRTKSPSPPPRGISSTQSVAVQTNQSEVPRTWNEKNPRRPIPPPLPQEIFIQNPTEPRGSSRHYVDSSVEPYKREHELADYGAQGRQNQPQNSPQVNYPSLGSDYNYYPGSDDKSYSLNSYGQTAPRVPVRSNPPSKIKNQQEISDSFDRYEKRDHEFDNYGRENYGDYNSKNFYRDNQNPIYVPPFENLNNPGGQIIAEDSRSYDGLESGDISEDHSFIDDENIQNQDISSTDGVVTRYACAIATVSSASESPVVSPLPITPKDQGDSRNDQKSEIPYAQPQIYSAESDDLSMEKIRRHNLLQQNLIRQLQGEQSVIQDPRRIIQEISQTDEKSRKLMEDNHPMIPKDSRRLSQETAYRDDKSVFNYPGNLIDEQSMSAQNLRRLPQETIYRDDKSTANYPKDRRSSKDTIQKDENYSIKHLEDHHSIVPREIRRLSQETPYRDGKSPTNQIYPPKIHADNQPKLPKEIRRLSQETIYRDSPNYPVKLLEDPSISSEPIIENNNTQDKINIFEGRNNSIRKQQQQQFKPLNIPRVDREAFLPPKINVVSPSKVFKPSFNSDGCRAPNSSSSSVPHKNSNPVDSSDEYLMSCASRPSRSIVLSKSESWHQLALSKSTLQVPQQHQPCALLKPPKPKSPSSLRLSKQYEASSSSDNIRKMEDKIQRYFQGPNNGPPESPPSVRRDPKTKRNFSSKKSQGSLMRSHTMPHIYDETSDVEKAFDSLFKEATRTDNRY